MSVFAPGRFCHGYSGKNPLPYPLQGAVAEVAFIFKSHSH